MLKLEICNVHGILTAQDTEISERYRLKKECQASVLKDDSSLN